MINNGQYVFLPNRKQVWIVVDLDNGDEIKGYYFWLFKTRKEARDHIKMQNKQPNCASLSQPIKMTQLWITHQFLQNVVQRNKINV